MMKSLCCLAGLVVAAMSAWGTPAPLLDKDGATVQTERAKLRPNNIFWWKKGTSMLTPQKDQLPLRGNFEYVCLFKVDTDLFKTVPDCTIESLDFSFQLAHIEGAGGGVIQVRPLKIAATNLSANVKYPLHELADMNAKPMFTFELPEKLERNTRYTFPLPKDEATLGVLQKGVVLTLHGRTVQINIAGTGWNHAKHTRTHNPFFTVAYSTPVERLAFKHRIKPQKGKYVTAKDGDFWYDGQPIRFSGANYSISRWSIKAAEAGVQRLLQMNFNSVRLWLHRIHLYDTNVIKDDMTFVEPKEKGDNSFWDCVDYFIARCQEEGIFIYFCLDCLPKVNKDDSCGPATMYLRPKYAEIYKRHIRNILNRVNTYTGQRYAEMPVFACWQIVNENGTPELLLSGRFKKWPEEKQAVVVKAWNEYLVRKYKDDAGLLAAWDKVDADESLAAGTVKPAPLYGEEAKYPAVRAQDYMSFVYDVYVGGNREFERVARSCAPEGVGVNVAPFVHATHALLNMHGQYADGAGDVTSCGVYQTPYTRDKAKPFYPYEPFFRRRPHLYNLNFQTSARKPFVVYEYSPHWPYTYRAEYAPMMAFLGAGLGWDSLYFYNFSLKSEVDGDSPLKYSGAPLPEPYSTSHDGYCYAFNGVSDEVTMSTLAVTGQAFVNGIAPNQEETRVIFGRDAILNPLTRLYNTPVKSAEPIFAELADESVKEYQHLPGLYGNMIRASVHTRLGVDFDRNQKAAVRIEGKPLQGYTNVTEKVTASPDVTWDPPNEINILDNAHSKIAVGVLPATVTFRDGVRFEHSEKGFGYFGLSARDGLPVAQSKELVFALTATSHNTKYKLNPEKMINSPLALIPAIENRGEWPVIFARPFGKVTVPGGPFTLKRYTFAGYCYKTELVTDGAFEIEAGEPLFLATLTR